MEKLSNLEMIKKEYELNLPTSILNTIEIDENEKQFLREDKFSLVIAVISDQSVKSERAWKLPHKLKDRIGKENFNPYWMVANPHLVFEAIKSKPALHRFPQRITDFILSFSQILIQDYEGSTDKLLLATNDYGEFIENFKRIQGISNKKANLMFLILLLDFNLEFVGVHNSQTLFDVHIKRYLDGVLEDDTTQTEADEFSRAIDPENPARVSPFLWNKIRNNSL